MKVEPAQRERVQEFIGKARTRVSEGDVVAGTGLDVATAKAALYDLMKRYSSSLDVHEDGTLVYDFGQQLVPLGEPTWGERLRKVGRWLWRGFSFVYKASLAVVLVVYAVVFLVLIIAAAIAASASSEDEGPAEGAFHLVALVFRAIFEFATFRAVMYDDADRWGYPHKHYEPKHPVFPASRGKKRRPHTKSFIASVYDFVLGPARVEIDDRAQHREVAAFVRKRSDGVLTVADIQALSGMDRREAERFFARFVAEFDGEAEVTEGGDLYATFPELMRSSTRAHDEPIIHYWDEYEPPFELTGNTAGKNILVTLLAGFNLACSIYLTGAIDSAWLGTIPTVIFGLYFAIPIVRAPWVWWQNRKQHLNNIRKRLFRAIFHTEENQVALSDLVDTANALSNSEEKLDAGKLKALLEETVRQVGGQLDHDARDQLAADLARLRGETRAREEHGLEVEEEAVAYSTRN